MGGQRLLIRRYPIIAALIFAAALALRVLVPGGYMPVAADNRILVQICTGTPDGPDAMLMAIPGLEHKQQPGNAAQGKCAYADLAEAMTGGADPVLLAAALAFALALALSLALTLPPMKRVRLRPPLRGPPLPT